MVDVRRATPADIDASAGVLALAFQDDPGTVVFEPDAGRRAAILPPFFATFVGAAISEDGGLVVAGDPIRGIASWFGPERHGPSPDAMGAHGFGDVLEQAGSAAAGRLLAMIGEIEAQHVTLITEPHLRLQFFGVEPNHQRTGIGTALIEHGHARAAQLGLPCYLETFTEQNVRYYTGRGYAVAGTYSVGDGVPVYGMVRPPAI